MHFFPSISPPSLASPSPSLPSSASEPSACLAYPYPCFSISSCPQMTLPLINSHLHRSQRIMTTHLLHQRGSQEYCHDASGTPPY